LSPAPILLFAFKRPGHIKRCLESLAQNKGSARSQLHIFIDGPKTADDVSKVEEVKKIAASQHWCEKTFLYANTENRGVPRQVIDAVTQFSKDHGKVIVLEDDLVLSPHFLDFINTALDKYANEPRVMEVTGYLYPIKGWHMPSGFLWGNCGWGWGTWGRAWRHFEPDGRKLLAELKKRRLLHRFNFNNYGQHVADLKKQIQGKLGGWDVRWHASCFLNEGLTLYPGRSLVKNIGLDDTGINCITTRKYDVELSDRPITEYPARIEESSELFLSMVEYWRWNNSLRKKIIDRLAYSFDRILWRS